MNGRSWDVTPFSHAPYTISNSSLALLGSENQISLILSHHLALFLTPLTRLTRSGGINVFEIEEFTQ